jgi:hypothetical protein
MPGKITINNVSAAKKRTCLLLMKHKITMSVNSPSKDPLVCVRRVATHNIIIHTVKKNLDFNRSGSYSQKLASIRVKLSTTRYPAACYGEVHFFFA